MALISEATTDEILEIPKLFEEWNNLDNPHEFEPMIEWKGARLKRPEGLVKLAEKTKELIKLENLLLQTVKADIEKFNENEEKRKQESD